MWQPRMVPLGRSMTSLQKPVRSAVDDRPRERVEADLRDHYVVTFAGRRLRHPDRGVFGVGETAKRVDMLRERLPTPERGIGAGDKRFLHRLMDDHRAPSDVAGGEDVRRSGALTRIHTGRIRGRQTRRRRRTRCKLGRICQTIRSRRRRSRSMTSPLPGIARVDETDPRRRLESLNRAGTLEHCDAVVAREAPTAAATSASSLGKIRGAASNSCTRDPRALKIDATCTPVAPAPTTSMDAGTPARLPRVAVGRGQFERPARQLSRRGRRYR